MNKAHVDHLNSHLHSHIISSLRKYCGQYSVSTVPTLKREPHIRHQKQTPCVPQYHEIISINISLDKPQKTHVYTTQLATSPIRGEKEKMSMELHAFEPAGIRRAMQISRHLTSTPAPRRPRQPAWERLIRYLPTGTSGDGRDVRYGEPILEEGDERGDVDGLALRGELEVWVLEQGDEGDGLVGLVRSGEREVVGRLLGPVDAEGAGVVRCLGEGESLSLPNLPKLVC